MKFARQTFIFGITITGAAIVLSNQPADALRPMSTGTGFAITEDGYIITNNHVVTVNHKNRQGRVVGQSQCQGVTVKGAGHNGRVKVIARDSRMDLAVLKLGSSPKTRTARNQSNRSRSNTRIDEYAARDRSYSRRIEEADRSDREQASNLFESGNSRSRSLFEQAPARRSTGEPADRGFDTAAIEPGEGRNFVPLNLARLEPGMRASVIGFPKGEKISSQLKINTGVVVATVGLGDNSANFQTDAAINSGNSGGPVVDQSGNLIGVAVAKIVSKGVEGFNFAIKSQTVARFLETHNIDFQRVGHGSARNNVNIYRDAKNYTVLVTCFN